MIAEKMTKKRDATDRAKSSSKAHEKPANYSKPSDGVLRLHQTIGNKALQGLFGSGFIQGKLTIGQPNDIYEQEADRVADEVMRMPEPELQWQPTVEGEKELLHPKLADISQLQTKIELRTKQETEQTPPLSDSLSSRINAIKGSGAPLSKAERDLFEPRFGQDFSDVRVHNDSQANQLAESVNAQAFTYGNDLVFSAGKYPPASRSGEKLLAHELVHVVQQNRASQIERGRMQYPYPLKKTVMPVLQSRKCVQFFRTPLPGWGRWQLEATDASYVDTDIMVKSDHHSVPEHTFTQNNATHTATLPRDGTLNLRILGNIELFEDVSHLRLYAGLGTVAGLATMLNRSSSWQISARWGISVSNGTINLRLQGHPSLNLLTETPVVGGPPWHIHIRESTSERRGELPPRVTLGFDISRSASAAFTLGGSIGPVSASTGSESRPLARSLRFSVEMVASQPPLPASESSSLESEASLPSQPRLSESESISLESEAS